MFFSKVACIEILFKSLELTLLTLWNESSEYKRSTNLLSKGYTFS